MIGKENKKSNDNHIDYNWSRVSTKDFINMFVIRYNDLIDKRFINRKKIKINDFRSFLNYFKKISK